MTRSQNPSFQNCSYVTNPGYPSRYSETSKTCSYTVKTHELKVQDEGAFISVWHDMWNVISDRCFLFQMYARWGWTLTTLNWLNLTQLLEHAATPSKSQAQLGKTPLQFVEMLMACTVSQPEMFLSISLAIILFFSVRRSWQNSRRCGNNYSWNRHRYFWSRVENQSHISRMLQSCQSSNRLHAVFYRN